MYMHYLINDIWSRLEVGWYFHAYTVADRIKAKNLLCVSALSMNTQVYDGNKTMMATFWLEHMMLEYKHSHKQESKQHTRNTVFIAINFRHQWNIDFALMVVFILLVYFCERTESHRCLRKQGKWWKQNNVFQFCLNLFFLLSRKKYSLAYKIQEICRLHMYNNLL